MTAILQETRVIPFSNKKKAQRKTGLNTNQKGSVRSINGKWYVDFMYLGERVRENSGLDDTKENLRLVRQQLNRITIAIEDGTFRFAKVFPKSSKKDHFNQKESEIYGLKRTPDEVNVGDYIGTWYERLKHSGRVSERTLYGYRSNINLYLMPFFGKKMFGDINLSTFEEFIVWAKKKRYRKRPLSNETLNKVFVPLKTVCKSARGEFGWTGFDPFLGFKKLPEGDAYEKIRPFTIKEQGLLIEALPDHWKPYFMFAFYSGLRQGEQIGLKIDDIDWEKNIVHVRRAITKDENGKKVEGKTKNRYSRRSIKMTPVMREALKTQQSIYDRFQGEYFFCSPEGDMVLPQNLRTRVWIPALAAVNLRFREMKQTRHSFATVALSCGENPLWIAKVMGHRDVNMIIRVYGKYIEDVFGSKDGTLLNSAFQSGGLNKGNNG